MTDDLGRLASERGLRVIDYGNGHFQLAGGPLLVNYYPTAKRRSAYVAGTTGRRTGVTPQQAVEMCFKPPAVEGVRYVDNRSRHSRIIRRAMLRKSRKCRWCGCELTLDTSTVDHVIPLFRGGLDNANNRVIACEPCNSKRGHAMPELC